MTARPRVTVAAITEQSGRFLMVRERLPNGALVINQPAGHVEAGESVIEAVMRETFEETAWRFRPEAVVGVYLWQHPTNQTSFLRIAVCGAVLDRDARPTLDKEIDGVLWLSQPELSEPGIVLRSPLVMRGIEDYRSGERYPLSLLKSMIGVRGGGEFA